MNIKKKLIAFDLDTKALKECYPSSDWRKAYKDIEHYMKENGFIRCEGSIYISDSKISWVNATEMLQNMKDELIWLKAGMRDCVMANLEKNYSMNYIFKEEENITEKSMGRKSEEIMQSEEEEYDL